MSLTINPDIVTQQELQSRGVDSSVGVFGSHHVQIGKGSPIRLDVIKSANVPFAGFRTVTQIQRGKAGIEQTASDALKTLASSGSLDAGKLLGLLKAQQTHLDRLAKLNQLDPAQKQDADGLWMFTKAVESLSNEDLASIFQKFTSSEMDLLQTALMREGQINPAAKDARIAASRLFNVQALVLKEIGNRAALSNLSDLRGANPADETLKDENLRLPQKLSDEYGSSGVDDVAAPGRDKDITVSNLAVLAEVSSQSATKRENIATTERANLDARGLSNVQLKEMGDVLRSAELTINIPLDILSGETSVVADPTKPLANIWHLHDQHIDPKGTGYLDKRDSVEKILFPEFSKHDVNADERPVYGALNVQHGFKGGSPVYGNAVIVLKPEVARRATYIIKDTFLATPLKVDERRRADFYRLLPGAQGIPDELKTALLKADSQERKDMDALFDNLQKATELHTSDCMARDLPTSVRHILDRHDANKMQDGEKSLLGLVYSCFADSEGARQIMASHDNIESLLPQLGNVTGNALAQAALEKRAGRTPNFSFDGPEYIEAQIQGPIMPLRDIAEIRVDMDAISEDELDDYVTKMENFQRQTGIKVVFQSAEALEGSNFQEKIVNRQYEFNVNHLDMGKLNTMKDAVLADPMKAVTDFIAENYPDENAEGIEQAFTEHRLSEAIDKFKEKVAEMTADPMSSDAADIVSISLRDCLVTPMRTNRNFLQVLSGLHFDSAEEKKVFTDWIHSKSGPSAVNEIRLVHQQSTARAQLLRELAAAEPPPSGETVLARFAALQAGVDSAKPARVAAMTVALLRSATPPITPEATQKLISIIDSPTMRCLSGQLKNIADAITLGPASRMSEDREAVRSLVKAFTETASALAKSINAPWSAPRESLVPLSAIQANVRAVVRQVSPVLADALDAAHPAHPTFPAPANPGAMPQTKAERKQFLLDQMEVYREKELNSEWGRSVHGRGHIIRAYIYANAFCNILKEQGINVDRNAVILGITGHDLGRGGLGHDRWEKVSAKMTGEAIRRKYGDNTAGEAYEKEVADSIVGVKIPPQNGLPERTIPVSPTLEAQLLQSADSLDIGRTGQFEQCYFDFLRDKNGAVHPDAQKIRDQLAVEADLLQRLTNPLCAHYPLLHKLEADAQNTTGALSEELWQQRRDLEEYVTNEMVAQGNDANNEAFIDNFENVIREHPQMFPLLTQYYINGE